MDRKNLSLEQVLQIALDEFEAGRYDEAERICHQVLQHLAEHAFTLHLLGLIARDRGDTRAAVDYMRRSVHSDPDNAKFHYNLGLALITNGEMRAAISANRRAIALKPDLVEAYLNLGDALRNLGKVDEAVDTYRAALSIKPDYGRARTNLLFTLAYHVMCPPGQMLEEHREWDRIHGAEGRAHAFTHAGAGDPDRRLRIGYASPDLRRHAVSYFMEPILAAHDRAHVEVICYAEVAEPDDVTERLRDLADHWRSTVGLSDRAVAEMIHSDGIDILVDLAGHTAQSRIGAFTYKPAPVQATYLGYFTTTGLAAMDYWISDDMLHPAATTEMAVERIFRLPRCSLCYRPPPDAPPVAPRGEDNTVTFGSFNNLLKLSPSAIALWSRVMHAVPHGRLVLKSSTPITAEARRETLAKFAAQGIAGDRLVLGGPTESAREHLALYNNIDIALDTVPRTGGTTTAEALWMGAPVVTLAGERYIERLSATMLAAVGLDELITHTEDEFVDKAVDLAAAHDRRGALRRTLRERVAASPLYDAGALAGALEQAYREMWREYLGAE